MITKGKILVKPDHHMGRLGRLPTELISVHHIRLGSGGHRQEAVTDVVVHCCFMAVTLTQFKMCQLDIFKNIYKMLIQMYFLKNPWR